MVICNTVLGEELLFRGLLLPRMQGVFGKWDWLANGLLVRCLLPAPALEHPGQCYFRQSLFRLTQQDLPQFLVRDHPALGAERLLYLPDAGIGLGIGVEGSEVIRVVMIVTGGFTLAGTLLGFQTSWFPGLPPTTNSWSPDYLINYSLF
ncbi:MAG: hypothetical protein JXA13_16380 [Anaerolineales bacterium]|nr:hypothetical protein [Anaerolineales bacterium]